MSNTFILRLPSVLRRLGLSRSTIYAWISKGLWPKPIQLGPRAVGWPSTEVSQLTAARIAGQSDDEIRHLVKNLESSRKLDVDSGDSSILYKAD